MVYKGGAGSPSSTNIISMLGEPSQYGVSSFTHILRPTALTPNKINTVAGLSRNTFLHGENIVVLFIAYADAGTEKRSVPRWFGGPERWDFGLDQDVL